MKPWWLLAMAMAAGFAIADHPSLARRATSRLTPQLDSPFLTDTPRPDRGRRFTTASIDTFVLADYRFGSPGALDPQGWITIDLSSAPPDTFFHVDDFAGVSGTTPSAYTPLSGSRSLWCGTTAPPDFPQCVGTGCYPGYLNNWDQRFESIEFPRTGDVVLSFRIRWDSEPDLDFTRVEYFGKYGYWQELMAFDGRGELPVSKMIPDANLPATLRLRFRFTSDDAWSDEDCQYPTDGAVILDDVSIRDATGLLDHQDFEAEPLGARTTADGHWKAGVVHPYGDYSALAPGAAVLQEDPCASVAVLWTFFEGSTWNYGCGGHPEQKAIPKGNVDGLYIHNEIWSPLLKWDRDAGGNPIPATASVALLEFDVYRDMPLDNLVFYVWHVRSFGANQCPGPWRDRNFVYYGGQKDWLHNVQPFADLVPAGTIHLQAALGVRDMCAYWCGIYGYSSCHSQSPMFGRVTLKRVDFNGPLWSIRDIDQFQDSFAGDGTITGTVRADMARDVLPGTNLHIVPGDSTVVSVNDPLAGIADDPVNGGKKIYIYVAVWPLGQPTKTGANLSGGTRWPFAGDEVINGVAWAKLRLDQCILNGNPVANTYCVDLRDDLFTPGDTVCFFYGAENTDGVRTYAFGSNLALQGDDSNEAAANPAEFTCLPAGGWSRGGDVLYVDGMDGRGSQPYWDLAFQQLGLFDAVDRYDVRGPSSGVSNRPDSRVKNVLAQLVGCYRIILWDCGDLSITLGQGTGTPQKTDDYDMVNTFLGGLTAPGGVYICGDDVAEQLNGYAAASATTFKTTYVTYTLTTGNHRPTYGINPTGVGAAGGCFDGDTFVIYGGCPLLNDFDVMKPTGLTSMEMGYGTPATINGAVISKVTANSNGVDVGVILSGFSFVYIRDDDTDGVADATDHLHDILTWLGDALPQPTEAGRAVRNGLGQNYPNPFNPETSIAFSIRARAHVTLTIFDVSGARVRALADDTLDAGPHTRVWDGRNDAGEAVSSGMYFYRLVAPGFSGTRKMVLLK